MDRVHFTPLPIAGLGPIKHFRPSAELPSPHKSNWSRDLKSLQADGRLIGIVECSALSVARELTVWAAMSSPRNLTAILATAAAYLLWCTISVAAVTQQQLGILQSNVRAYLQSLYWQALVRPRLIFCLISYFFLQVLDYTWTMVWPQVKDSYPQGGTASCGYSSSRDSFQIREFQGSINANDPLIAGVPSNGCGSCVKLTCNLVGNQVCV